MTSISDQFRWNYANCPRVSLTDRVTLANVRSDILPFRSLWEAAKVLRIPNNSLDELPGYSAGHTRVNERLRQLLHQDPSQRPSARQAALLFSFEALVQILSRSQVYSQSSQLIVGRRACGTP